MANNNENRKSAASQNTQESEVLHLQSRDHHGMSLVSVPLDGNNFLTSSRAIFLAIEAKLKLGKWERPAANSNNFEQWQRVEYMEVSWLFNSISKDIAEAFVYTTLARDMWLELETGFGESNGPRLY
ncbi:hypothetical protein Sango_2079900 [Sesamum angolense]|uniref:Retrotransposon Copia-like N-terminal domain-containing protein n=1 Tax=Sesamum angolense TaxID=2727404 RepID=A0AAE1WBK5_9LAMI|nr:hypothetical protein Sango_2079900 [Sesamum angolense]